MPQSSSQNGAPSWASIDQDKHRDEEEAIRELLNSPPLDASARAKIVSEARQIVARARASARKRGVMESFLEEFGLSNKEGLALMCLAEALLRVPDETSIDRLIAEKIKSGNWADHRGKSSSLLVNASTWGLMLTGRIVSLDPDITKDLGGFVGRLVARAGEPVIRAAMMQAMRIMGEQFVLGRNIEEGLKRGDHFKRASLASSFSFDMLGEGARTKADAQRYFESYSTAIAAVNQHAAGAGPIRASGISVKLSALHPRYEARSSERVFRELLPAVKALAMQARAGDIGFCLDAEEADRLVISLELLNRLALDPDLAGYNGLGLAVQAYQKRASRVIHGLVALSEASQRRFMVRLVKGAYWDSEIKRAQTEGRPDFPVWTNKAATDLSYLTCAKLMLENPDAIYPQFATHNAHSLAAIRHLSSDLGNVEYEFQRLHGMGDALYVAAQGREAVRVYAPIGEHEDLLPYLVRRLLENGANTSFVHSFLDEDIGLDHVITDPITALEAGEKRHKRIPIPPRLYGAQRANSAGFDLTKAEDLKTLNDALARLDASLPLLAGPVVAGKTSPAIGEDRDAASGLQIGSPADRRKLIGQVRMAQTQDLDRAIVSAQSFQPRWDALGGVKRARFLRRAADLLQARAPDFIALCLRESGKNWADAIAEIREAIDFLRYYALEAERQFGSPERLPGPAGETNHLSLHGRGIFVCISPWNFPLAIFVGQVAAALAAGNCVLAKPAEQTPLIAFQCIALLLEAGIPPEALHFLPGDGHLGAELVARPEIAGVAFTGSSEVARLIHRSLAAKDGPIASLIAETGGLNGMFVDTTALKEQVIDDVIQSAFGSAGQRCSALRLLFVPHDTADALIAGIAGAMKELSLGDPAKFATDIGPVIDKDAWNRLRNHCASMAVSAKIVATIEPPPLTHGTFFGPTLIEIADLSQLQDEVFGPVLHVLRYDPDQIEAIGAQFAATQYGLTLGIHTRLDSFVARVRKAVPAGNIYVNRSMIGAVVGVQPFGGERLSGTGPKAGGPHYLARFATERTLSVNVTAQGGDPELLNLS